MAQSLSVHSCCPCASIPVYCPKSSFTPQTFQSGAFPPALKLWRWTEARKAKEAAPFYKETSATLGTQLPAALRLRTYTAPVGEKLQEGNIRQGASAQPPGAPHTLRKGRAQGEVSSRPSRSPLGSKFSPLLGGRWGTWLQREPWLERNWSSMQSLHGLGCQLCDLRQMS